MESEKHRKKREKVGKETIRRTKALIEALQNGEEIPSYVEYCEECGRATSILIPVRLNSIQLKICQLCFVGQVRSTMKALGKTRIPGVI